MILYIMIFPPGYFDNSYTQSQCQYLVQLRKNMGLLCIRVLANHIRVREAAKSFSFFGGPATKRGAGGGPPNKEKGKKKYFKKSS